MERLRFDAIFFGSVVSIAVLLLFTVLSFAVGFSTAHQFWVILVLGAVSIIAAFFSGGFVASRMSAPVQRLGLWIEGASVWAITIIVLASLMATFAGPALKTVLSQIGIGVVATAGVPSAIEQFSEMNPRFETDLKISEGKAITQFKIDEERVNVLNEAKEEAKEQKKEIKEEVGSFGKIKEELNSATRTMAWALFGVLFLSLGSSLAGVFANKNMARSL